MPARRGDRRRAFDRDLVEPVQAPGRRLRAAVAGGADEREHAARGRDRVDVEDGVAGADAAVGARLEADDAGLLGLRQAALGGLDERGRDQRRDRRRARARPRRSSPGRRRASRRARRRGRAAPAAAASAPSRSRPSGAPGRRRAPSRTDGAAAGSAAMWLATNQPPRPATSATARPTAIHRRLGRSRPSARRPIIPRCRRSCWAACASAPAWCGPAACTTLGAAWPSARASRPAAAC